MQGLWEYPWPASFLLDLPLRFGASSVAAYMATVIAALLVIDAAFAWLLWRQARMGFTLWLLVAPALGPLMFGSWDLVPAVVTAAALLGLARSRPGLAGGLLSLGVATKLWPLVGLPALLVPGGMRERRALLGSALAIGLALLIATVAAGGVQRLMSPLAWQERRGLQVEAFAALPFLWARHFDPAAPWTTPVTQFNCFEVKGPGVDLALQLATLALVLGALGLAWLHVRAFRAPESARTPALAGMLLVLGVLVLIVSNKAFTPQYMLWLAAPLAVLPDLKRADSALFLGACILTQLVFPLNYDAVVTAGQTRAWVLGALTLRDALLVALGTRLAAQVWRSSARA